MLKRYLKSLTGLTMIILITLVSSFTFNTTTTTKKIAFLDMSLTNNPYVLSEENFEEQMLYVVEPYVDSVTKSGYFVSFDNTEIYYECYTVSKPKGAIVISHGFTESLEKYIEMIYYFLQENYSVYALDHRGHGLSERTVTDLSLVDVKDFNSYITDLYTFVSTIVLPQTEDLPLFLYAHSMGGGIGAIFLENYPNIFNAAILTSPMMGINLSTIPRFTANLLANTSTLLGQGAKYIISHKLFDGIEDLEDNSSNSISRFNYYFNKKLNNEHLQTTGASYSWIKEALIATQKMVQPKYAALATTPILLFQSENDSLVFPDAQCKFVNNAPNIQMIFVPNAKHELYTTSNELFIPYLNTVLNFYETHLINSK